MKGGKRGLQTTHPMARVPMIKLINAIINNHLARLQQIKYAPINQLNKHA